MLTNRLCISTTTILLQRTGILLLLQLYLLITRQTSWIILKRIVMTGSTRHGKNLSRCVRHLISPVVLTGQLILRALLTIIRIAISMDWVTKDIHSDRAVISRLRRA